jgi:TM2 domain-containing membrane protein YozV
LAVAQAAAVQSPPQTPYAEPQWQTPQPGNYADQRVRGGPAPHPGAGRLATGKNPAIALILSLFIPGVGQLYNGDNKKGVILLIGLLVSGLLAAFAVGIVTGIAIWVYAMVDAYQVASGTKPIRAERS